MIPRAGLWNIKKVIQSGNEEMFVRYILKIAANFEKIVLQRDAEYGILVCDCSDIHYGNYFHKRSKYSITHLCRLLPMVKKNMY